METGKFKKAIKGLLKDTFSVLINLLKNFLFALGFSIAICTPAAIIMFSLAFISSKFHIQPYVYFLIADIAFGIYFICLLIKKIILNFKKHYNS